MFEARLKQAEVLKKVLDAVKELVTDANFDCSDEGIKLQAMDNSHVALVSLQLDSAGFEEFRCDRNLSLGMSLASLQKIVKCAGNDDVVTLRADDSTDVLGLLFENKKLDRVGEYEMKLMDIDAEHLGIPETVYDAEISLPAAEFARIIRDLKELGESVKIEVSKEGVRFSADGDIGSASVTLKPTVEDRAERMDEDEDEDEGKKSDDDEEEDKEDESEGEGEDDDVIIEDAADEKPAKTQVNDAEAEDEKPELEEGEEEVKTKKKTVKKEKVVEKKRKAPSTPVEKAKGGKKAKGEPKAKEEPRKVTISVQQAVNLTFSIKYLSNFAKSTPLSDYVHLRMSNEVPLLVEYSFAQGHIRYYLAPKIAED